jgi:hypothetical protein
MSASPYGRHDVTVIGGMPASRNINPRVQEQIEKDAAELVRIQQEARARLLGGAGTGRLGDLGTGSHALASAATTEGGSEV